jgi:hypothetical protein
MHTPSTFVSDLHNLHVKNYPEADIIMNQMGRISGEIASTTGKFKKSKARRESSADDRELKKELNRLSSRLDEQYRDGKFSGKFKENVSNLRRDIKMLSDQIEHYWDPQVRARRERGASDVERSMSDVERDFRNDSSVSSTYERHPELNSNTTDTLRKLIRNFMNVLDHYWDPEREHKKYVGEPEDIKPNFWEPENMTNFDERRTTEDDSHRIRDSYQSLERFIRERETVDDVGNERSNEEPGWKQRSDEAKENGLAAPKHEGWDGNEDTQRERNNRSSSSKFNEDSTRYWNSVGERSNSRYDSDRNRQNKDRTWDSDAERFTDKKERFSDRTDRFSDRSDVERENKGNYNRSNNRKSNRNSNEDTQSWNEDVERSFSRPETNPDRNRDRLNR